VAVAVHRQRRDRLAQRTRILPDAAGAVARGARRAYAPLAKAQMDQAFAALVVAGLHEIDAGVDMQADQRHMAVVMHGLGTAGMAFDGLGDLARKIRALEGIEHAQLLFLPAWMGVVEAGHEGPAKAEPRRRIRPAILAAEDAHRVAVLDQRIAERDYVLAEAAHLRTGQVFGNEQDAHRFSLPPAP
jgi:hypothetical protein